MRVMCFAIFCIYSMSAVHTQFIVKFIVWIGNLNIPEDDAAPVELMYICHA